ncbi:MAG: hypothetical protein IT374_26200 [Polyangiaceae bacterium]|nr:hypothetical protein [Polyangiaceae bacterium]
MTAIAIVGSRLYPDLAAVRAFVRDLPDGTVVVTGTRPPPSDVRPPRGVDETACAAASERGLAVVIYAADWLRHGRAAGPIRNRSIAEHCDRMVAFWDGASRGTGDAIRCAESLGKPVEIRRPA